MADYQRHMCDLFGLHRIMAAGAGGWRGGGEILHIRFDRSREGTDGTCRMEVIKGWTEHCVARSDSADIGGTRGLIVAIP